MSNVKHDTWKGYDVSVRPIAVRLITAPTSPVEGYLATVRIEKNGQILADWHLLTMLNSGGPRRRRNAMASSMQ